MFSSYQRTHNHIPHPPLSHVAILSSPLPPPLPANVESSCSFQPPLPSLRLPCRSMLKLLGEVQQEEPAQERRLPSLFVLYDRSWSEHGNHPADRFQKSCINPPRANYPNEISAFCKAVPAQDCCITNACTPQDKARKHKLFCSCTMIKSSSSCSCSPTCPTNL